MHDGLVRTLEDIAESIAAGRFRSGAAISQGVVMRVLGDLGWPIFDVRVVVPAFRIGNRKVDYALCHSPGKPAVLMEVRDLGRADGRSVRRLVDCCARHPATMGVLTDGRNWKFFYVGGEGVGRGGTLFAQADLDDDDCAQVARTLSSYLDMEDVVSGAARRRAERDYEMERAQVKAASAFPSVWRRMVTAPDPSLLDLFSQQVEKATGVVPNRDRAAAFVRGVAESRPRPRSRPSPRSDRPRLSFTFRGRTQSFVTGTELLGAVFREFASRDPDFCRRYSERFSGRTRQYVARSKDVLYPGTPQYADQAVSLPGGWWLGTHFSNDNKLTRIKEACEVVGLELGRDIVVNMPPRWSRTKARPKPDA